MSLTTVAAALPAIPDTGRPFAKVDIDVSTPGGSVDQLPQALQRLICVLWTLTGFGEEEIRITTKRLAELCERCERWVYKALRQGLNHRVDDQPAPLIAKRFEKGPRDVAGRVISLVVNFAKSKEPADPKPKAKAKEKPKAKTPAAAPVPATAEAPVPPGMWAEFRKNLVGAAAALGGGPKKTEAEKAAEVERKRREFDEAARRRAAKGGPGGAVPPGNS